MLKLKNNFLLESLAACKGSETKTDLEMYFMINLAFVNYFNDTIERARNTHFETLDNPGTNFTPVDRDL